MVVVHVSAAAMGNASSSTAPNEADRDTERAWIMDNRRGGKLGSDKEAGVRWQVVF